MSVSGLKTILGGRIPPWVKPILLVWLAALAVWPGGALALEWTSPPGMDVPGQEQALKKRVMLTARDIVGEELLDVIVHVGYLRVGDKDQPESMERLKLPGFDRYIVPPKGEGAKAEIFPEFARIRQVIVMVTKTLEGRKESLARDITARSGLEPAKGDQLQVVAVERPQAEKGEEIAGKQDEKPPLDEPPAEPPRKRQWKPGTADMYAESRSAAHLIRARKSYFRGDFSAALDQILQAISIEPNNSQAYSMLGSMYYAMKWKSLAVKYWEKSMELDPQNRELEELLTRIRLGQ
ncbi:MAG: hypothetical protein OEW12_09510 [Deltaproteobacteria bacterium]|nr:hypothetical protein [Deltaproteobacteria bacterium]